MIENYSKKEQARARKLIVGRTDHLGRKALNGLLLGKLVEIYGERSPGFQDASRSDR